LKESQIQVIAEKLQVYELLLLSMKLKVTLWPISSEVIKLVFGLNKLYLTIQSQNIDYCLHREIKFVVVVH